MAEIMHLGNELIGVFFSRVGPKASTICKLFRLKPMY